MSDIKKQKLQKYELRHTKKDVCDKMKLIKGIIGAILICLCLGILTKFSFSNFLKALLFDYCFLIGLYLFVKTVVNDEDEG